MEDHLDAADRAREQRVVADVAFEELDAIGDVGEVLALAGREVVDDANAVAARDQRARDRRSDEAGAAGDEIQTHG